MLALIASALLGAGYAQAAVAVSVPDPNLNAAIRAALGIPDGEDITDTAMASLTDLDLTAENIQDLTGIQYAVNMRILYLPVNQISDPSPLAGLVALEHLNLGENRISDVSALTGLTGLHGINLNWNQVSDLTPLAGFNTLQALGLSGNQISDLAPLAGLTNLEDLYLNNNQITEIDLLANMPKLENLQANNNQITDINSLGVLNNLILLELSNNLVYDVSALGSLPALAEVDLTYNYLNVADGSDDMSIIDGLISRGVRVTYSPQQESDKLVQDFVARFYQACLGRLPDREGLDYWVDQLVSGEKSGADVSLNFVFSDEFISRDLADEEFLTVMYRTFFDREPDNGGLYYWLGEMDSGKSRLYVLADFVNSTEFDSLCADYGIIRGSIESPEVEIDTDVAAFVARFYQLCLDRQPDSGGLNYWVDQLLAGMQTGADLAQGFIFSPEFEAQTLTDTQYISIMYQVCFDRTPDAGGLAYWGDLMNGGMSRLEVLANFVNSDEFAAICSAYGINPGVIKL